MNGVDNLCLNYDNQVTKKSENRNKNQGNVCSIRW